LDHMPSEEMKPVFASTVLKLHPDDYTIVSLPVAEKEQAFEFIKSLGPFSSVTVDLNEVSLILRADDWVSLKQNFASYEEEGPYRVITFDIILDLSLIGYLSVVSAVLADAGISIYTVSTYLRDHILVKAEDSGKAMTVLGELIQKCKSTR
jgi:hypothetical protein